MVVEGGAGCTGVVPVFQGFVLQECTFALPATELLLYELVSSLTKSTATAAMDKSALGGDMLDELIMSVLEQQGAVIQPRFAVSRKVCAVYTRCGGLYCISPCTAVITAAAGRIIQVNARGSSQHPSVFSPLSLP